MVTRGVSRGVTRGVQGAQADVLRRAQQGSAQDQARALAQEQQKRQEALAQQQAEERARNAPITIGNQTFSRTQINKALNNIKKLASARRAPETDKNVTLAMRAIVRERPELADAIEQGALAKQRKLSPSFRVEQVVGRTRLSLRDVSKNIGNIKKEIISQKTLPPKSQKSFRQSEEAKFKQLVGLDRKPTTKQNIFQKVESKLPTTETPIIKKGIEFATKPTGDIRLEQLASGTDFTADVSSPTRGGTIVLTPREKTFFEKVGIKDNKPGQKLKGSVFDIQEKVDAGKLNEEQAQLEIDKALRTFTKEQAIRDLPQNFAIGLGLTLTGLASPGVATAVTAGSLGTLALNRRKIAQNVKDFPEASAINIAGSLAGGLVGGGVGGLARTKISPTNIKSVTKIGGSQVNKVRTAVLEGLDDTTKTALGKITSTKTFKITTNDGREFIMVEFSKLRTGSGKGVLKGDKTLIGLETGLVARGNKFVTKTGETILARGVSTLKDGKGETFFRVIKFKPGDQKGVRLLQNLGLKKRGAKITKFDIVERSKQVEKRGDSLRSDVKFESTTRILDIKTLRLTKQVQARINNINRKLKNGKKIPNSEIKQLINIERRLMDKKPFTDAEFESAFGDFIGETTLRFILERVGGFAQKRAGVIRTGLTSKERVVGGAGSTFRPRLDSKKLTARQKQDLQLKNFREKLPSKFKKEFDKLERIDQLFWEGQSRAGSGIAVVKRDGSRTFTEYSKMKDKGFKHIFDIKKKLNTKKSLIDKSKGTKNPIVNIIQKTKRFFKRDKPVAKKVLKKETKPSKFGEPSEFPKMTGGTGQKLVSKFAGKSKGFEQVEFITNTKLGTSAGSIIQATTKPKFKFPVASVAKTTLTSSSLNGVTGKSLQLGLGKSKLDTKSKTIIKQSPTLRVGLSPKTALSTKVGLKTKTIQKTATKTSTKLASKPATKPPFKPKIPTLVTKKTSSKKVKKLVPTTTKVKKQGHDVFYRPKNEKLFKKANAVPLKKKQAVDLGAFLVDHSLSATYRVKKSTGAIRKPLTQIPKGYGSRNKRKFRNFRIVKGKKVPIKGLFIEKSRYRLDKDGEKKSIRASRLLAELRKKKIKRPIKKIKKVKKTRTNIQFPKGISFEEMLRRNKLRTARNIAKAKQLNLVRKTKPKVTGSSLKSTSLIKRRKK